MLFTSYEFFWLLVLTFALYYAVSGDNAQVYVLLAASFVFYGWSDPALLLLLIASISINAIASFQVARVTWRAARVWAAGGVIANLAILASFKYGVLLISLIAGLLPTIADSPASSLIRLPLPIGISFYTFEGISLLVDVFRQRLNSAAPLPSFRRHLANTSLFIAFFPHLIAGPILKAKQFYPQISPKHFRDIQWEAVARSLIVGYFLKMVVADNLQDYTFWLTYPYCLYLGTFNGVVLLYGYSIQIYADFAGYSLIAIGLAGLFGYQLPANFNLPYISRSIADFWRRWHISLSTWLRDYLYFPLGGNRKGNVRTYLNLIVVMALGGLWHGAAWSYLIWGCYHGLGLAIERWFTGFVGRDNSQNADEQITHRFASDVMINVLVFSFVSFGWLFFKLPNFGQAMEFISMLAHAIKAPPNVDATAAVLLFSMPVVVHHVVKMPRVAIAINSWRVDVVWAAGRYACLGGMVAAIALNRGSSDAFIYFQF